MKNFVYKKVRTVEEAIRLLSQNPDKTMILAGGFDLLGKMKSRLVEPEVLVSISEIQPLSEIKYDKKEGLTVGALARLRKIERSEIVRKNFSILSETATIVGPTQYRNQATLGGNICNASPASDIAVCLICLDAKVVLTGQNGSRMVRIEDFFKSPGETHLGKRELLEFVSIPNIPQGTVCFYVRETVRKAMDRSIAAVAVALTLDSRGETCEDIRLVLGAVAPIPVRAIKTEKRLKGNRMGKSLIQEAAILASEEARPITDLRASAKYRKQFVKVLVEKALKKAKNGVE